MLDARPDRHDGRLVEHGVDPVERIADDARIADVADDESRRGGHVLTPPHRKVVEHGHGDAPPEERAREVVADEAGAARHEDTAQRHSITPSAVTIARLTPTSRSP
jgi:hypothetical protein